MDANEQGNIAQYQSFAANNLASGRTKDEVKNDLIMQGVEPGLAEKIVASASSPMPGAEMAGPAESGGGRSGLGAMVVGIIIAMVGIGITVGSYSAAGQGGGYVVTYGLVIFGAITAIKGFVAFVSGK